MSDTLKIFTEEAKQRIQDSLADISKVILRAAPIDVPMIFSQNDFTDIKNILLAVIDGFDAKHQYQTGNSQWVMVCVTTNDRAKFANLVQSINHMIEYGEQLFQQMDSLNTPILKEE